jgi:uncharacterized phage protein (TIGR02218 family)
MVAFLLSKEPYYMADLFKIYSPLYNQWIFITSFDQNISFGSDTWYAQGPLLTRTSWSIKNDLEVSTMDMSIASSGQDYGPGNIKQMIHNGFFDNSEIWLQRAVMPTPGDTSLGLVDLWFGVGGKVSGGARGVQVTWNSRNAKMLQQMPKNRYELNCIWPLYSVGCTRLASAFTWTATVDHADRLKIFWTSDPTGGLALQFKDGFATFNSGAAVGQRRSITNCGFDGVVLASMLYTQPNPGDTFSATFGCDKTRGSHGCAFFNNLQNFRGFPYIPPATFSI